jgi:hypothetical protein
MKIFKSVEYVDKDDDGDDLIINGKTISLTEDMRRQIIDDINYFRSKVEKLEV